MDEKQKQEMKEKANAIAAETAQKAKDAGKAAAAKADELYNKLPLDKINEKLGGKVDVKSSKTKKILFAIFLCLILLVVYSFFSSSDTTIPNGAKIDLIKAELSLSKNTLAEFYAAVLVNKEKNKNIPWQNGKETFGEYARRCKNSYSKEEMDLFKKHYEKIKETYSVERETLKKHLKLEKERIGRRKILAEKAPELLNKAFDESFDTCKKVEVGDCFYVNGRDEWYKGRAYIYNSKTGKTRDRAAEMWINIDNGTIMAKLE